MRFAAVLFDLFDTLVLFDRSRLPLVEIDGKAVHTTAAHLHAVLREHRPELTLPACYRALAESWQEAERQRAIDHREVSALVRFEHFLRCLALDPAQCPRDLVATLADTHRRELGRAAHFPPHHGPLLRELGRRRRLAVVSNFDYTPTALDILDRTGVADVFASVVISDEIGWRKPRPEIFVEALARVDVRPADALFVGDRLDIDVAGAQRAGMQAAWINRERALRPAGVRPPEFELADLDELRAILDGRGGSDRVPPAS
jgi:HAD superfamily hydrolase (TIGR01509 family)